MKRLRAFVAGLAWLLAAAACFAHAPSFSRLTLDARDDTVAAELSLAPPDRDSDGRISAEEYATARTFLRENAATWFELKSGAAPVVPPAGEFVESFEDHTLVWKATLPLVVGGPGSLSLPAISRLGEGHREYVAIRRDGRLLADALLSRAEPGLQFSWETGSTHDVEAGRRGTDSAEPGTGRVAAANELRAAGAGTPAPAPGSPPAASRSSPSLGFLKLGVEHILASYDHLLFLAGLVLVCRKRRDLLVVVTSFTAAHSITLALATLGGVRLPSALVEPLIAASIVFVGVENLVRRDAAPRHRWALVFGFGLIHGFGFAGALRDAGLGTGFAAWRALAAFNLGVEAGQLALVAATWPLLEWARRRPEVNAPLVRFASAAVVASGAFWLTQRLGPA